MIFHVLLLLFLDAGHPGLTYYRPNIVFMLVDDLGWNDVSFHGSKQVPTPNIDALAKDGVTLNNYYVDPTCSPSRASLLTGRMPWKTGFHNDIITTSAPWGLPLEEKILPQYLKPLGYSTHGVGKWHQGFCNNEYLPTNRGFDAFFGFWSGVEDYYTHFSKAHNHTGLDLHDCTDNQWQYEGRYGTELFTQKAVEVIMNHNPSKPLFLYFAQQSPHSGNFEDPLQVPHEYVRPFSAIKDEGRKTFAGMLSAMDHSVGEIIEALDESRMLDNTIFIFSTDNGGIGENGDGTFGSNFPLRGSKYTFWEGGVRGVGLVWSPFLRHNAREFNGLMHLVDWLPTLISAAGGTGETMENIDGLNLWPSLRDRYPSPRTKIIFSLDEENQIYVIRKGNFKLVIGGQDEPYLNNLYYDENGRIYNGSVLRKTASDIHYEAYHQMLMRSKVARTLYKRYHVNMHQLLQCDADECDIPTVTCGSPCRKECTLKDGPCLFDIVQDPCEYCNLVDEYPDIMEELQAELEASKPFVVSQLKVVEDPFSDPVLHCNAWVPWLDHNSPEPCSSEAGNSF